MHRAVKMRMGLTSSGKTLQTLPSRNIRLCFHHQENSQIWWVIFLNIVSMLNLDNYYTLGGPCWCSQTGKTYRGGWNDKFFFALVCSSGLLSTGRSFLPRLSHSWLAQVFDDYIYYCSTDNTEKQYYSLRHRWIKFTLTESGVSSGRVVTHIIPPTIIKAHN